MKKIATITISKRHFDKDGKVLREVEKKFDLRLVYAFIIGSLFGSIMAVVSLFLQGMVTLI